MKSYVIHMVLSQPLCKIPYEFIWLLGMMLRLPMTSYGLGDGLDGYMVDGFPYNHPGCFSLIFPHLPSKLTIQSRSIVHQPGLPFDGLTVKMKIGQGCRGFWGHRLPQNLVHPGTSGLRKGTSGLHRGTKSNNT